MRRRICFVPVAVLAAVVAANPASAADGNGWTCISPFADYTNRDYPDDPPAPSRLLDSLAISVDAHGSDAADGRSGPDARAARPAAGAHVHGHARRRADVPAHRRHHHQLQRHPVQAGGRHLAQPHDPREPGRRSANWWSCNAGTGAAQVITWVQKIDGSRRAAEGPCRRRPARHDVLRTPRRPSTLAHRYMSHTGNSQFPLDAWVTIAASNTVEGVQTMPVKGNWTVNIKDATPGLADERRQLRQRHGHRDGARRWCCAAELEVDADRRRPGRVHDRAARQARRRADREQGLRAHGLQHAAQRAPVRLASSCAR